MWPFTRKPKPINPGPINEDWRVGDLAECINDSGWSYDGIAGVSGPDCGDVLTVVLAMPGTKRPQVIFIGFKGWPSETFAGYAFRKLVDTKADEQFTASIRALQPSKVGA